MFIDKANIIVKGGNGGDGCSSFRREKYIPKGGPNGGDGGRGGDVYVRASARLKTLMDFSRKPRYEAERGQDGMGRNSFGRDGHDLILQVPLGTTIMKEGQFFADLLHDEETVLVAKGGRGGRGNVHFKSSTRQAPRIAERGEPAESARIEMQLRLMADVGFVGFPNAGKSTLLSRLTRAHPKIANYPFTTLFPNLGVTIFQNREIVFADVPGLIEGSHRGKGLGHQFLQHLERTRILVHVVDPLGYAELSPLKAIRVINKELKHYSSSLAQKPQMIAINKSDLSEANEVFIKVKKAHKKSSVFLISGVTGDGIDELLRAVAKQLVNLPPEKAGLDKSVPLAGVRVKLEPHFWVEQDNDYFIVRGKKIEKLVQMTPFHLPEAVERTQNILRKLGVEKALMKHGAVAGDMIRIAGVEFSFEPEASPVKVG